MARAAPRPPGRSSRTITRNWNELLQELRVTQTGVQILTGFLLTLPFTSVFGDLEPRQTVTYLVVLAGAVLSTGFVVAPVAFHRVLFRRRQRHWIVEAANVCARLGLVCFALTSCGVLFFVFDVVLGPWPAGIAFAVAFLFFVLLWGVVPWWGDHHAERGEPPPE